MVSRPEQAHFIAQLRSTSHRLAVDPRHHVPLPYTGLLRRRIRCDLCDHSTAVGVYPERLGQAGGEILDVDAETAAFHFTVFHELPGQLPDHVDGDREADADVAPRRRQDRRVDADELALQIDQGTAGVARVNGRIGLYEILVTFYAETAAPQGADDSRGDGLVEAERIADRHHEVTNTELVRVARGDLRQVVGVDPDNGHVRVRVGPHQFRLELPAVVERNLDLIRFFDDVGIGHHQTLIRIDHHAGSEALTPAFPLPGRQVEEPPEERVAQQRILTDSHGSGRGYVDHPRQRFLQHRRQARHLALEGGKRQGRRCERRAGHQHHGDQAFVQVSH